MRDKKVLLFDLDGTLVDSVPDLAGALNKMLLTLGYETYSEDTIRSWVGNGALVLVKRALCGTQADKSIDDDILQVALDVFLKSYKQNLCNKTTLYPNVKQTLYSLKQKGFLLTIVTNKPEEFIQPLLSSLGIAEMFEICVGADTLKRKKPDPLPLIHISKLLDLSVDECVMIGDSKNDILAAKACQMDSIGVNYGYNYDESILVYEPNYVIDDFSELLNIVELKS